MSKRQQIINTLSIETRYSYEQIAAAEAQCRKLGDDEFEKTIRDLSSAGFSMSHVLDALAMLRLKDEGVFGEGNAL